MVSRPKTVESAASAELVFHMSLGASALTALATLLSFISYVVAARYFGVSAEMDAYLIAAALPVSAMGIFITAISIAVVPVLASFKNDTRARSTACRTLLALVIMLAVAASLVGVVFARGIISFIAPQLSPAKLRLAAEIHRVLWAATSLSIVANFLSGVRCFEKRFGLAAALPMLPPLGMIVAAIMLAERVGIVVLAWGYLAGFLLQCALLAPTVWPWRVTSLEQKVRSETGRQFLSSVFLIGLSLLVFGLIPVSDAFWASQLQEGSLSYLGYAFRIVVALTGIAVHGHALVLLPFLADDAAERQLPLLRARLAGALRYGLALTVPLACLLTVLRGPILTLLFQRGRFDAAATQGVAAVLPWYLIGLVGTACTYLLVRGFYSLSNLKAAAVGGVAALCFYWILSGLLSALLAHRGIAIAYALYWMVCLAGSVISLSRQLGPLWDKTQSGFLVRLLGISGLAAFATQLTRRLLPQFLGSLAQLLVAGSIGLLTVVIASRYLFGTRLKLNALVTR